MADIYFYFLLALLQVLIEYLLKMNFSLFKSEILLKCERLLYVLAEYAHDCQSSMITKHNPP